MFNFVWLCCLHESVTEALWTNSFKKPGEGFSPSDVRTCAFAAGGHGWDLPHKKLHTQKHRETHRIQYSSRISFCHAADLRRRTLTCASSADGKRTSCVTVAHVPRTPTIMHRHVGCSCCVIFAHYLLANETACVCWKFQSAVQQISPPAQLSRTTGRLLSKPKRYWG